MQQLCPLCIFSLWEESKIVKIAGWGWRYRYLETCWHFDSILRQWQYVLWYCIYRYVEHFEGVITCNCESVLLKLFSLGELIFNTFSHYCHWSSWLLHVYLVKLFLIIYLLWELGLALWTTVRNIKLGVNSMGCLLRKW